MGFFFFWFSDYWGKIKVYLQNHIILISCLWFVFYILLNFLVTEIFISENCFIICSICLKSEGIIDCIKHPGDGISFTPR